MTSPAITKSPQNQKVEKKSPTHSTGGGTESAAPAPEAVPAAADVASTPPDTFSWLRIFKLADLMVKQGC